MFSDVWTWKSLILSITCKYKNCYSWRQWALRLVCRPAVLASIVKNELHKLKSLIWKWQSGPEMRPFTKMEAMTLGGGGREVAVILGGGGQRGGRDPWGRGAEGWLWPTEGAKGLVQWPAWGGWGGGGNGWPWPTLEGVTVTSFFQLELFLSSGTIFFLLELLSFYWNYFLSTRKIFFLFGIIFFFLELFSFFRKLFYSFWNYLLPSGTIFFLLELFSFFWNYFLSSGTIFFLLELFFLQYWNYFLFFCTIFFLSELFSSFWNYFLSSETNFFILNAFFLLKLFCFLLELFSYGAER